MSSDMLEFLLATVSANLAHSNNVPYELMQAYYKSRSWKSKRLWALKNADNICQACGGSDRLHVHHLSYENFGFEEPQDLTVNCAECHEIWHISHKFVTEMEAEEIILQGPMAWKVGSITAPFHSIAGDGVRCNKSIDPDTDGWVSTNRGIGPPTKNIKRDQLCKKCVRGLASPLYRKLMKITLL